MTVIEYLKKEIEKTGYPLEIRISSILDKNWDLVFNTDTYFDRDEKKLRDIDIVARDFLDCEGTLESFSQLVIECKKSSTYRSPYANFERPLLIDVVTSEYFGEYLKLIKGDKKSLNNVLCLNAEKLSERMDEIKELIPKK